MKQNVSKQISLSWVHTKKGLLSRIVLGSTSEGILHDSDIPMLIIQTHKE